MSTFRHVIWDWNGTLLDDNWLCLEIINQMMSGRGMRTITLERYREIFGFPLEDYCRNLGFDFERESYEELSDRFMEVYERRRLECGLQSGAVEVLDAVQRQGVEQSLLSAYRQERLRELVAHYHLERFFSAVIGVDNHYGDGKVELGKRRIEEIGLAGEQVLLVGDTLHDLEVARGMGIDCALVSSGHQNRRRLGEGGGRVVGDLKEVEELIIRSS